MSIGTVHPAECREFTDPETGRRMRQLTSSSAHSYPLYYFIPSITNDGRYLIFHSERGGRVNLFGMDLTTGQFVQLTDGRTPEAGWAIWCQRDLCGIYNHLAALNVVRDEVYYFQDEEIRCTHVRTLENRRVDRLPGRMPIGQTGFSPDGRLFVFIHADRELFTRRVEEYLEAQRQRRPVDHQAWRNTVPCTIAVIDTQTGACRTVVDLDYHVHHVMFADDHRLLVNHPPDEMGMWLIGVDGTGCRHLRPRDACGAVCHQCVTDNGILYEAYREDEKVGRRVSLGRYDLKTDQWDEFELPERPVGHHVGRDPAGRLCFFDTVGREDRGIYAVLFPMDEDRRQLKLIRRLAPLETGPVGQRGHGHPFLSPDRRWLFHTAVVDGTSQVGAIEIGDLSDLLACDAGWPACRFRE